MRNPASRRRSAAAALAALALLPMTACGSDSGTSDDVYRIGLVHSSEGPFATNSETMRAGARYAAELINADGGVNGRDIELVEVDYRNDPQSLVTDIPKLVSEDQVFAIVAPVDSAGCEIACLVASDLKVPIVSAGAGRPGVLEPSRPWSFTMTAPDAANSIPVLSKVMEDEGVKTAAIIVDEANATTEAQSALYEEVFDATGVEVVSTTTYTSGDSSFTSQVTSMAAKNPDVVALAAGPADASRIAAEVGAQGLDTLLIGTGSLQAGGTDYINGAGEAAEGTITAAQFNPDNPDEPAASLLAEAEKANDLDSVSLNFSYAFDIVNLMAQYLEESDATGGSDDLEDERQGLLDFLEDLEGYEGMSGDVQFADDGTGDRPELKAVVKDGEFVISEASE